MTLRESQFFLSESRLPVRNSTYENVEANFGSNMLQVREKQTALIQNHLQQQKWLSVQISPLKIILFFPTFV
jgi:hypothetical protein